MAKRGRPRKSAEEKRRTGTLRPGREKAYAAAPGPEVKPRELPPLDPSLMQPPDWLDDVGLQHWHQLVPALGSLLTEADRTTLAFLCNAFALAEKAERLVDEQGLMIRSKRSGLERLNPAAKLMLAAMAQAFRFAEQFGCTPVSRARLQRHLPFTPGPSPEPPAPDEHERFFFDRQPKLAPVSPPPDEQH